MMNQKIEEKSSDHNISISIEVWDKLEDYIKTMEKEEGVSFNKRKFFDKLLTDFFKGKTINNTFIELESPLFFNFDFLFESKEVLAKEFPIGSPLGILERVPNNLDKFHIENGSYYYMDIPWLHRGICIIQNIPQEWGAQEDSYFLIIEYNEQTNQARIGLNDMSWLNVYISNEPVLRKDLPVIDATVFRKRGDNSFKLLGELEG